MAAVVPSCITQISRDFAGKSVRCTVYRTEALGWTRSVNRVSAPKGEIMRTAKVDDDHVVEFSRISRDTYTYRVRHVGTGRVVIDAQSCTRRQQDDTVRTIVLSAGNALRVRDRKRLDNSIAYADGKPVAGAPTVLPPTQQEALARGELDISAGIAVAMIRQAYAAHPPTLYVDRGQLELLRRKASLVIGRQILIGATDDAIIKIATGKATLTGSLRTGVVYSETP